MVVEKKEQKMIKDIEIGKPYGNPTTNNPNSQRRKVVYKDFRNNREITTKHFRFIDKETADDAYNVIMEDYFKQNDKGYFPKAEPKTKILTFRDYATSYEEFLLGNCKESAHSSRKSEMKLLIEYFNDTPLHLVDREAAKNLKTYLDNKPVEYLIKIKATERTRNPKTNRLHRAEKKVVRHTKRTVASTNSYLKRLRHLNGEAVRDKKPMVVTIDFKQLILPEKNKPSTTTTFGEFEKLLSVCIEDRAHLYLQVLCIFEASCRTSEMKAVRKRDLTIESQMCWVNISKQKKNIEERPPRRCYFPKILIDAIIADGYHEKSDNDFLFDTRNNQTSWETAVKLAFSDTTDEDRRKQLLKLQMQRSLRKSAGVHYDESEIREFVKEYQMGRAPVTTGGKHYREVKEKFQFEQFQKYENYSKSERLKLQKAKTVNG